MKASDLMGRCPENEGAKYILGLEESVSLKKS